MYSHRLIDLSTLLNQKIDIQKKIIFAKFEVLTEAFIIASKVLSKQSVPQVKNSQTFFRKLDLNEASSDFND